MTHHPRFVPQRNWASAFQQVSTLEILCWMAAVGRFDAGAGSGHVTDLGTGEPEVSRTGVTTYYRRPSGRSEETSFRIKLYGLIIFEINERSKLTFTNSPSSIPGPDKTRQVTNRSPSLFCHEAQPRPSWTLTSPSSIPSTPRSLTSAIPSL